MKIGTQYFPEQWPRSQWEFDISQMRLLGLQQVHIGKLAWPTLEPRPGEFHFDWLKHCLDLARQRDLGVVLVTPTASPPRWLGEQAPDAHQLSAAGRRFYSPVSEPLRHAAARLLTALVEALADHPALVGWEVSADYATPAHPLPRDERAFAQWLADRYKTIEALNKAWGCEQGHLSYEDFTQLRLPALQDAEQDHNPHQHLDAARFWSWAWGDLAKMQAQIIQPRLASRTLTIRCVTDNWACNPADFVSDGAALGWDNYPVAARPVADGGGENYRLGDPSAIGLTHAVIASFGGRWAQTELQVGQISRGGLPTLPYPGAARLWLWTALAHGAAFANANRFRRPLAGPGLFDDALAHADGASETAGGRQFAQVISELRRLDPARLTQATQEKPPAQVGLIFDAEQFWQFRALPHAGRWDQEVWLRRWYAAFSRLGLNIAIVHPGELPPQPPAILAAPGLQMVERTWIDQFEAYASAGGHLLLTCRSGLMDRRGQLWSGPTAAPILPLIGASIEACDAPPPGASGHVYCEDKPFAWDTWGELLYADDATKVLAKYTDQFYAGAACVTRRKLGEGTVTYCGVFGQQAMIDLLAQRTAERAGLKVLHLPSRVQVLRRGPYHILLNYQDKAVEAPAGPGSRFIVGGARVEASGVAVWE